MCSLRLLVAMIFAAMCFVAPVMAQPQSIGDKDASGRSFLFNEELGGGLGNSWTGMMVGGSATDQADVHIRSDGKTVFEGTLSLNCSAASGEFWKTGGADASFSVPREVLRNARRVFCSSRRCPVEGAPGVQYSSKDPSFCARALIRCAPGTKVFSNQCGCGCLGHATTAVPAPVPAPQPVPVPQPSGQFTILQGIDLFGNDYRAVRGKISYNRCLSRCRNDRRCKAFTYNTRFSKCFLKSRAGNRKPYANAISGVRQAGGGRCLQRGESCKARNLRNSCCQPWTCQELSEDAFGVKDAWECQGSVPEN